MSKLLHTLFPNGIGTRGVLAFMVVGALAYRAPVETLLTVATAIITFYFVQRDAAAAASRANGNGGS